jgi:hypothetical protein
VSSEHALQRQTRTSIAVTVDATAVDTEDEIRELREDDAVTRRAIKLLGSKRKDSYETALATVREDTLTSWAHELARSSDELGRGEEPVTANVEGLHRFLEGKVQRWYDNRNKEPANRPLMREQAFREALDPDKLERLGRYEVQRDNYELTSQADPAV